MQNKTEVYKYFVEYVNRYENELDGNLKKVKSDNGTEFTNREFEDYLKHKGIKELLLIIHKAMESWKGQIEYC